MRGVPAGGGVVSTLPSNFKTIYGDYSRPHPVTLTSATPLEEGNDIKTMRKSLSCVASAKWGFTLIELLVVIVIIGIIASLTFVALNGVRAKARDTKRIADIRNLQSALDIYKSDNDEMYPQYATSGTALVGPSGQTYMAKIPTAPTNTGLDVYTYTSTADNTSYSIGYYLSSPIESGGPSGTVAATPGNNAISVCLPQCTGLSCGNDGCGGSCGTCSAGLSCTAGACVFTCGSSTVTDVDGNTYNTVAIGSQCWFKENLKTTQYKNSTPITNVTVAATWLANTTGAYSWYNNDSATYKDLYGALYNWYAVNNAAGLCPTGWHVPTTAQYNTMFSSAGVTANTGAKLKAVSPVWDGSNTSGFNGIPAGTRGYSANFSSAGSSGTAWFWQSSGGSGFGKLTQLNSGSTTNAYTSGNDSADYGHSVRCLKD